jgi:hypothetical protein
MSETNNPTVREILNTVFDRDECTVGYRDTLKDFVEAALEESEYDGLYCPDEDCACSINDDIESVDGLFPCGNYSMACKGGFTHKPLPGDVEHADCGFVVSAQKPEERNV